MAKAIKKEEELVLITWDSNWADEMDIQGFVVTSKEQADEFKKRLKEYKSDFSIGIGTNEDIEYGSGRELLDELSFQKITKEEDKLLETLFDGEFGHTEFWSVFDYIDEWEDDEDE